MWKKMIKPLGCELAQNFQSKLLLLLETPHLVETSMVFSCFLKACCKQEEVRDERQFPFQNQSVIKTNCNFDKTVSMACKYKDSKCFQYPLHQLLNLIISHPMLTSVSNDTKGFTIYKWLSTKGSIYFPPIIEKYNNHFQTVKTSDCFYHSSTI